MSCKSAIYTVSTAVQAVVAGNSLSLGSTIRRFGCSTTLSGNAIALNAPGYYDVDVSVTAIPTAAGTVSVTLFQDGVAVPGAVASATTTAATNSVNLSLCRYGARPERVQCLQSNSGYQWCCFQRHQCCSCCG